MIDYLKIKPEVVHPTQRIPDPLVFPFSVFMQNGGYLISAAKDGIVFRKGKLTGKIIGEWEVQEDTYAMNLHCIHRFKMFTELYLKSGQQFLDGLRSQGVKRLPLNLRNQYLKAA
ncbi:hypothetical protein F889_01575 [Acinetobacter colistiniresistens]|uniref:Uncharacterized protein n=1 Tax=Acinetobacter colistiniresistens TaxID=280145 RepID=N9R8H7_9GAMM|nr:hypothetical protein [Acinetobacter colistiniresistens]ENX34935.1 hypothetical protein F889_01575 [Acinetobacter colistiniresistens]